MLRNELIGRKENAILRNEPVSMKENAMLRNEPVGMKENAMLTHLAPDQLLPFCYEIPGEGK